MNWKSDPSARKWMRDNRKKLPRGDNDEVYGVKDSADVASQLEAYLQTARLEVLLLEQYLAGTPYLDIAKDTGLPVQQIYWRINNSKRAAKRQFSKYLEELKKTEKVDLSNAVTRRSRVLRLRGREVTAFLIENAGQTFWVNEVGERWHPEVEEVLQNLTDNSEAFEHIEVDPEDEA